VTSGPALELTREQVLAHRRRVGALDERLKPGPGSLRRAAWAGLTDSMPRAALLSIHARVRAAKPDTWRDPSLVQVWGPRFSAYVVCAQDRWVFTLGRLPDEGAARRRAETIAERADAFLAGRRLPYGEVGRGIGVNPNMLRYGATTGRLVIEWDGARQPVIRSVPPPTQDPQEARAELVRRYLHVLGPGTAAGFGDWAGIRAPRATATFERLTGAFVPVRTTVGDGWILAEDEASFRAAARPSSAVRLLPSGDTWYLLQGLDRALLVPDAARRPLLWTPRVWPGAVTVGGEVAGTWRRAGARVSIEPWGRLAREERAAIAAEAESLPLPAVAGRIAVEFQT
jgi:hypothetical protein